MVYWNGEDYRLMIEMTDADTWDVSELVPAVVLAGNLGLGGQMYLYGLRVSSQRTRNEKLIDVFVATIGLFIA